MNDVHELSPKEYFLSTQIQSRLDDLKEVEERESKKSSLFYQFSHKSQVCLSKGKFKAAKIRPRKKRKPSKKLSMTDQTITKLSGKPHKLRQLPVHKRLPVEEQEAVKDQIYTAKEWDSLKYRLWLKSLQPYTELNNEDTPDLNSDEWEWLYDRTNRAHSDRYERHDIKYEVDEPITLSQFMREMTPETLDNTSGKHEQEQTEFIPLRDKPPISETVEVIEISDNEGTYDISEVSNTSLECSLISTNNHIMVGSSDDETGIAKVSTVRFRGVDLRLRPHAYNVITLKKQTSNNETIINETDDDTIDDDYLLEIKRAF